MEKASTPRNRLTRSSAKQLNVEQEGTIEKGTDEEVKQSVRKTRSKNVTKIKTNGDTTDVENRANNEDVVGENLNNKCNQEDLSVSIKPEDNSKATPKKTPSSGVKRSLRTRRSSTSGPELLDSGSKEMKRSSSFGKLDLFSTPTKKRGRRAQSESKDFVFTPTKGSGSGSNDSNNEYIPNSSVRKIDKIDEVNESEKLSDDEKDIASNLEANTLINCESESKDKIAEISENIVSNEHTEIKADSGASSEQPDSNLEANTLINCESGSKDKIAEISENIVSNEHTEIKADSGASSEQPDLSIHSKTEVSPTLNGNDTSYCRNIEIHDFPQKNECSNIDRDKENSSIIDVNIEIENIKLPLDNECTLMIDKPEKETNDAKIEDITIDTSKINEKIQLSNDNEAITESHDDCGATKVLETNDISYNNTCKNAENKLEVNDNDASETQDKSIKLDVRDEQLQSNLEEDMKISENETKSKTQRESEVSEIDLVISSDSEDNSSDQIKVPNVELNTFEDKPLTPEGNLQTIVDSKISHENDTTPGFSFTDAQFSNDMRVEKSHMVDMGCSVSQNHTSNTELGEKDSLLQDRPPNSDSYLKPNEMQYMELNNTSCPVLDNQVTNRSDSSLDKQSKPLSVNSYNENEYADNMYEEEELNKYEEDSCDIYKGLSDSGSYVDEIEEGSPGGSHSSRINYESGDSEYVSSAEEEEDNKEDTNELSNDLCSKSVDTKAKELVLSMDVEKPNEKNPDSPMTYDKVLSIINKNRIKKIDDEEFFDMFTEELNRVSEKSGSDSDIAIVDEYVMEPEESSKKNQQKTGFNQNVKQSSRLTGPVSSHQPIPPENYPSDFNQLIPTQHDAVINQHGHPMPSQQSHPPGHRANFSQGSMYQQFDHSMHLRNHLMYNQYPSSSMQDPHMFNPSLGHPDVNYSSGMYNPSHHHPLGPAPQSSFPTNSPSLKVRNVVDMNTAQSFSHKNYSKSDQAPDQRSFEHKQIEDNYLTKDPMSMSSNVHDAGNTRPSNLDTDNHQDFLNQSRTPILDLLGLDEKALKLLKQVLGLNSIERKLMKRDLTWQKEYLERNILKSKLRQFARKKETRYRNRPIKRFRESDSSSSSQRSQSSEEYSATSSGFFKTINYGSSSENEDRKINIEDGSVYVTLKNGKNPRRQRKKLSPFLGQEETVKQKRKRKNRRKRISSTHEHHSKKMPQKEPTVVKSQSGTFIVDPLTGTSHSSDSEGQYADEKFHLRALKRKMKLDLAAGRNKMSNIFAQRSLKKTVESRKRVLEPLTKPNLKKLTKLPTEILETLANEDNEKKRQRTEEPDSDVVQERPKKIRKKTQKMKVKSRAGEQNYVPYVTGGVTEFGLSRLDKDGTLTLAEKAAKFRTDQLYGASVKRITSKELVNLKKKQTINDKLAEKRTSRKRNLK